MLRVKSVFLQSGISIAGLGTGITTLSPEKTPQAMLYLGSETLRVETRDLNVLVPVANVKMAVLFDNEKLATEKPNVTTNKQSK